MCLQEALGLLRHCSRREKVGLEVTGKGDPEKSPLQITLRKMMKQAGEGEGSGDHHGQWL